jgi:hypothetical protein
VPCRLWYQLQEVKHSVPHISINFILVCIKHSLPNGDTYMSHLKLKWLQGLVINNSNNTNSLDRYLPLEHLRLWELPGFGLLLMLLSTETKRSLC